jgi:ribokinase
MAPRVISIIGALNADLIMVANRLPEEGESLLAESYYESLGGKGANSAIATYRACHKKPPENKGTAEAPGESAMPTANEDLYATLKPPVDEDDDDDIHIRMVGAVGADKYSELFHTELKKNGVDTSGLVTIPGKRSGVCFVIVEHYTGENRCLFTLGANEAWKEEDFMNVEDLAHGPRPDLVIAQMEIRKEVVQQMIETAGKAGIEFLLNAAPADPITMRSYRYITHLLVNESEAAIMSGRDLNEVNQDTWPKIAQEFLDRGVKNVVLTLGEKGAYYATATDRAHVPGYKVKVVDSTGAG